MAPIDQALRNALKDLRGQGAKMLPDERTVIQANDGTSWSGQTADGRRWAILKNKAESYNVEF